MFHLSALWIVVTDYVKQWDSPHGTFDPDPMQTGNLNPKTTFPPHGINPGPELRAVLCDCAPGQS